MEDFKLIEFQQERNFGKKINTTFEYLKQNFKPLGKSILIIAGPSAFIASIFLASFISTLLSLVQSPQNGSPDAMIGRLSSGTFWLEILMTYIFFFLGYVITIATINSYVWLYHQKKTNRIEVSEVWNKARSVIWKYLGTVLLMFVSVVVIFFAIVMVGVVLNFISTAITILFAIAAGIGFIYLVVGVSLILFIQVNEDLSFFDAAGRSLYLVKGKWWSTFGITFTLSLIGVAISYIFAIPYYIFILVTALLNASAGTGQGVSSGFKTATFIFLTFYYTVQILLQTLPATGLVFQYFNLVELKEAKGLMSDIENFGNSTPEAPREETY